MSRSECHSHGSVPFCSVTRSLAADLLLMIPDNELQLVKLCAFYPGCAEEINDLHEKVAHDVQCSRGAAVPSFNSSQGQAGGHTQRS